jgi:hypothetical protein
MLIRLAQELTEYCTRSPSDRLEDARKIERQAIALLKQLDKSG